DLQFINENKRYMIGCTGSRFNARLKLDVIRNPVDRIREDAADLRGGNTAFDKTSRMFADLPQPLLPFEQVAKVRLIFDARRSDEVVDKTRCAGDASFCNLSKRFGAFNVMIDPAFVIGTREDHAERALDLASQNSFDVAGIAELEAATDRFYG